MGGKKNQFLGGSFIGIDSYRCTDCDGKSGIGTWSCGEWWEEFFENASARCTFDRIAKGLRETYFQSRWINWNFHFNITTARVRGGWCACMRVRWCLIGNSSLWLQRFWQYRRLLFYCVRYERQCAASFCDYVAHKLIRKPLDIPLLSVPPLSIPLDRCQPKLSLFEYLAIFTINRKNIHH